MRLSLRRAMFVLCSPVVVALVAGSLSGCENQHIGRPCDLQVGDTGGATNGTAQATITGQVLQCPSRICILPAAEVKTDTGSYCTAECTSNDDCSDGEKRNMSNPDDKRCTKGYACGIASEVGAFCCKKLCICLDFVDAPGGQLPEHPACLPGMSTCHNVK